MSITFALNLYDNDGDVYNDGVFLFFGDTTIIKVKDIDEIEAMIKSLQSIHKEISGE